MSAPHSFVTLEAFIANRRETKDLAMHAVEQLVRSFDNTTKLAGDPISESYIAMQGAAILVSCSINRLMEGARRDGLPLNMDTAYAVIMQRVSMEVKEAIGEAKRQDAKK